MRAYYASRLSPNISQTPEGYLVLHNVPIARTGVQKYFGEEIGLDDHTGESFSVIREEADVFSPAAIASFEGKPVTDEHPPGEVDAGNVGLFLKGVTRDVRRGEGEDGDKLLAELVIYSADLAGEIKEGKREVSCGYTCEYEYAPDGKIYQRRIRGNHVAVVPEGRAGSSVAIRDTAQSERRKGMKKTRNKDAKRGLYGVLSKLYPVLAKDADPEEVAEALEAVEEAAVAAPVSADEETAGQQDETPAPATDEEPPEWAKALMSQLAQLGARLDAHDEDPIEKLEAELAGGEEQVSAPAEEMDEEPGTQDGDIDPAQDEDATDEDETQDEDEAQDEEGTQDEEPAQDEEEATPAKDSLLRFVRTVKPSIAAIQNPKAKKRAADALVKAVRDLQGQPVRKAASGYAKILIAKASKRRAADSGKGNDLDRLQAFYDSLNPHNQGRR